MRRTGGLVDRDSARQMGGLAVTAVGAWLVSTPVPLPVAEVVIGLGLGLQYLALRPVLRTWRREVGPGRHRR